MPEIYEGNTGVYCIRNIRNGKRYVGSSAQEFRARRWEHWRKLRESRHENRHLQKSWNRYGPGSFVFQIIERCPREKCLEREQYWMDYFDVTNRDRGYNISPVAGSNLGVKRSKQTKANYAEKAKRQWADPEIRRRMQESMKRKAADPERRRAIIEESRRQARDPQWLKNNANAVKRRTADPEWQRKHAEAQARRWTKWRAERGEQA
jgi:group I intron endonuclease